jgi:hypothetical protein
MLVTVSHGTFLYGIWLCARHGTVISILLINFDGGVVRLLF